jgi:hypothetical protein
MVNLQHWRDYVIIPTLKRMGEKFYSPSAVCLLLGTVLHESRLEYLRQLEGGPALGFYQLEPATIKDIHENYISYRCELESVVHDFMTMQARDVQAVTNLSYATALARLVYFRVPEPLPAWEDSRAMSRYWKAHYNTYLGAGNAGDFEKTYWEQILT